VLPWAWQQATFLSGRWAPCNGLQHSLCLLHLADTEAFTGSMVCCGA
jgi:hypothetical protein